jgi:hypothetical protein
MAKNYLRNHLRSEFSQIPNALIEDRTLSATARALFCYLAVKPDSWEFYMRDIAKALQISTPTLRKIVIELHQAGWIDDVGQERSSDGTFGAKIFSIFPNKSHDHRDLEDDYEKNLPCRQKTVAGSNRSGKTMTHINTNSKQYSTLKNTSSSSEEDRGINYGIVTTFDPYEKLPEHIDGVAREIVIQEIENMAIELGGDFEKYRNALIQEVLSGKGRTINNIRARLVRMNTVHEKPWIVAHRKKREEGENLQTFMRENGYDNIFDFIEGINQDELIS